MEINRLDDKTFNEFKKRLSPVYEWWLEQVPDGKKYIDFIEKNHI